MRNRIGQFFFRIICWRVNNRVDWLVKNYPCLFFFFFPRFFFFRYFLLSCCVVRIQLVADRSLFVKLKEFLDIFNIYHDKHNQSFSKITTHLQQLPQLPQQQRGKNCWQQTLLFLVNKVVVQAIQSILASQRQQKRRKVKDHSLYDS